MTGVAEIVLLRGNVLVEGGELVAEPGIGQFVERARFGAGARPAPVTLTTRGRQSRRGIATRRHETMALVEADPNLGAKIVEDAKEYVLYSWSVQNAINPIAVAGAEGRYFWDYDGKRYLDFASQLVNV